MKGRLREMVTYEDLEEENEPKSIVLKITNKNQFSEGMATSVEATLVCNRLISTF